MPRPAPYVEPTAPTRRRSRAIAQPPGGFRYQPDFLGAAAEQQLLVQIAQLPFEAVIMHGVEAKRQVVHFGVRYAYGGGGVSAALPLPSFLAELSAQAAAEARFPVGAPLEALVTRYPPGAGIGWHRDAPPFGPVVVGVSLAAACEFRLRLATATGYDVSKTQLAPRSLYVLAGTARFRWQHMIPPVPTLRYSITFRTVRAAR
jgi:alkylated DNA repair dioxygenase AlkB